MSNGKVLVAGGAGYIGSHTCKALAAAGFEPVAYDNLSTGFRHLVQYGPLLEGDVRDAETLGCALREHQPVAVMHFAASAYVGVSVQQPLAYYDNNVAGSASLIRAMLKQEAAVLVFSSTCATYGIPEQVPILETTPQQPINPYGMSKLMVEQILRDVEQAHGLRHVALRYFNAAGADPAASIGECHEPETHLIPLALDAAAGKLDKLSVFGSDYPTADGTAVRDYIHVQDLADAHVRAMQHLLDGGESLQLNLGTGSGWSVRQVIDAVERVTGQVVPVQMSARRAGDPPELVAAVGAAKAHLGWEAQRSALDVIVADAWRWHQNSH